MPEIEAMVAAQQERESAQKFESAFEMKQSSVHAVLSWDSESGSWTMSPRGKNGIYLNGTFHKGSADAEALRLESQTAVRMGTTCFWVLAPVEE